MQYETIILEMMSRIQKLEEDVEELKNTISFNCIDSPNSQTKEMLK